MPFKRLSAAQSPARSGSNLLRLLQNHVGTDFDPNDFLIAGSARLFTEGITDQISDLDILARPGSPTWYRATDLALDQADGFENHGLLKGKYTGDTIAQLHGGAIEVFDRWLIPEYDTDELLDSAEEVRGLKYFSLEDILTYKRRLNRPKDQRACADIINYLKRRDARTHLLAGIAMPEVDNKNSEEFRPQIDPDGLNATHSGTTTALLAADAAPDTTLLPAAPS